LGNRHIPFGYRICGGEYFVYEPEATCVQEVYTLYLAGKGYQAIADAIRYMGVSYHEGSSSWNKHMIKRILENPRYMGDDKFPAILAPEMFDQVRRLRESKRVPVNKRSPKKQSAPPVLKTDMAPIPTLTAARLQNHLSRELSRPVLEPDRIRKMIFQYTCMTYDSYRQSQIPIRTEYSADAGSVRFDI
jgi:hypothetical protein